MTQARSRPRRILPVVDDVQDRLDAQVLLQARHRLDEGQLDEAFALLTPLAAEPSTAIRAQATLLAAALLSRRGQPALVLELLERIPDGIVVDRGFFLLLRAQAARQLRLIPAALRDADDACSLGETPARLLVLADCKKAGDDVDGAVAVMKRARDLDPDNAGVLGQLCGLLALADDRPASDEVWSAFLALNAGGSPLDEADRQRSAAFALVCRDDFEGAVQAAQRALQLEPDVTRAWLDDDEDMGPLRADPRLR